jgi:hypothetical protein
MASTQMQRTHSTPADVARTIVRRSFSAAPVASVESGAAPSVFDKIINLTIVDPSGARRKIKGMVGEPYDETVKVKAGQPVLVINWLSVTQVLCMSNLALTHSLAIV